ncbi:hypothetical protein L9F63_025747, partial [Diploptera punctata]
KLIRSADSRRVYTTSPLRAVNSYMLIYVRILFISILPTRGLDNDIPKFTVQVLLDIEKPVCTNAIGYHLILCIRFLPRNTFAYTVT